MNTEAKIELAKRAVACPGFRAMKGMSDVEGRLVMYAWTAKSTSYDIEQRMTYTMGRSYVSLERDPDIDPWVEESDDFRNPVDIVREQCDFVPSFDDPATLGCLLALVKEAWPGCDVSVATKWDRVPDGQGGLRADTERVVVEIRWPCSRVSSIWFNCRSFLGGSLGESLAEALIAAPAKAVVS